MNERAKGHLPPNKAVHELLDEGMDVLEGEVGWLKQAIQEQKRDADILRGQSEKLEPKTRITRDLYGKDWKVDVETGDWRTIERKPFRFELVDPYAPILSDSELREIEYRGLKLAYKEMGLEPPPLSAVYAAREADAAEKEGSLFFWTTALFGTPWCLLALWAISGDFIGSLVGAIAYAVIVSILFVTNTTYFAERAAAKSRREAQVEALSEHTKSHLDKVRNKAVRNELVIKALRNELVIPRDNTTMTKCKIIETQQAQQTGSGWYYDDPF